MLNANPVGQIVNVYNNTLSGERILEGKAVIRKVHQGDRGGVHADVEFLDDTGAPEGETFKRWVFASDQPES